LRASARRARFARKAPDASRRGALRSVATLAGGEAATSP
jgi:hypothetical protein